MPERLAEGEDHGAPAISSDHLFAFFFRLGLEVALCLREDEEEEEGEALARRGAG